MNTGLRLTFFLGLIALLAACGDDSSPADGGPTPDVPGVDTSPPRDTPTPSVVPYRIMSWNVENFFDNQNDPDVPFDEVQTSAAVTRKISSISAVIREENPDFVALQEVENLPLLQRLVDEGLGGMGYDYVGLMDSFDPRGIDVGYISRFPVTNVVSHIGESFLGPTGESQRFTRDALEVFVNANGIDVLVMTSHFLSQRCVDSPAECAERDARREGEAAQARDLLGRRANTRDHVIFAGDMNDTPESPTYAAMTAGDEIIDLTLTVPAADRWSFIFNGREQLDYMMGSQAMSDDMVQLRFVRDGSSDHSAIVADFQLIP